MTMKSTITAIPLFILILLGISCNTSTKKEKENSPTDIKVTLKKPVYSTDTLGTSLHWTAYKFTNKLGVGGTFDEFTLQLKTDSGSVEELLNDAEITINTLSVNSGNKIRDPKLRTSFFKVFNTDIISGKVIDAKNGTGILELSMNSISNKVAYSYSMHMDTLLLSTHLDLLVWDGEQAIKTLNKECYDLHTGTDGISKLWPDVDVVLKLPLQKE